MKKDILDSLTQLGLSDKEAAVYGALVTLKKGTALSIAKTAGLKRPTTYSVLASLQKKHLIRTSRFRGVSDYRLLPLGNLKKYISQQRALVLKHGPELQQVYANRSGKLRLRVYKSVGDIKVLLEKSLREKAPLFILGNEKEWKKHIDVYWQFYKKRAAQLHILPSFKIYEGKVQLLLWSDKVAFVELGEPIRLFGFKNKELHDVYKKIWKNY